MKFTLMRTAAGLGAFAVLGGTFVAVASSANAASNPLPWLATETSSGERVGGLTFYNGSTQVFSGSLSAAPTAEYIVTDGGVIAGDTFGDGATAYVYTPGTADPATWTNQQWSTTAPLTNDNTTTNATYTDLPASIRTSQREVVPLSGSVNDGIAGITSTYAAPNDHVYEIRVLGGAPNKWYSADIEIDPVAGTWTQVYPAPPSTVSTTISAITAAPVTPAPSGTTSVALSANLSAADSTIPSGSVELFDSTTDLGAASVDAAGHITKTATGLTDGNSHSYQFKFTAGSGYSNSVSPTLAYSVHASAVATTTTVNGVSGAVNVGIPVSISATIAPAAAGTVQFKLDGASLGAPVAVSGGNAATSYTPSDTSAHTITAVFTSSAPTDFTNSSDTTGVTLTAMAPTYTPDPQNVTVSVPAGTKTISTPYTAAHPLNLGTLQLAADGTHYSTTPVAFGNATAAAVANPGGNLDAATPGTTTNGVTITDTEAGSTGWTAHVVANDFTAGLNTISSHALEFLSVAPKYIAGNHIDGTGAEVVTPANVPDVKTGGNFASITGAAGVGTGSVAVTGMLDLHNVPTSTQPGSYTATLTFTIS